MSNDEQSEQDERWYDEHIAPKLAEIAKMCIDRGMPFVATVKYRSGPEEARGTTRFIPETPDPGTHLDMLAVLPREGYPVRRVDLHARLRARHHRDPGRSEARVMDSVFDVAVGLANLPRCRLAALLARLTGPQLRDAAFDADYELALTEHRAAAVGALAYGLALDDGRGGVSAALLRARRGWRSWPPRLMHLHHHPS